MRVLVIGGTGFIGRFVIPLLHDAGHTVTVFHRGTSGARLPPRVRSLRGDRHHFLAHQHELRALTPEVVIDMIASSGAHARTMMDTFRGAARRVVVLSSMDVYRACAVLHELEPGPIEPVPLTEDSPLRTIAKTYPAEQIRMLQRLFGWLDDAYDTVAVERTVQSDPELAATVLRLPMVYGRAIPCIASSRCSSACSTEGP